MRIGPCLIDTNVLLRTARLVAPLHSVASRAMNALNVSQIPMFYSHQNMAELWNVLTRPSDRNGFGLSTEQAELEVRDLEAGMNLLPESETTYHLWRALVVKHKVRGVQVHDARLVASMKAYGIQHLMTFNTSDFSRYTGIDVIHPETIHEGLF